MNLLLAHRDPEFYPLLAELAPQHRADPQRFPANPAADAAPDEQLDDSIALALESGPEILALDPDVPLSRIEESLALADDHLADTDARRFARARVLNALGKSGDASALIGDQVPDGLGRRAAAFRAHTGAGNAAAADAVNAIMSGDDSPAAAAVVAASLLPLAGHIDREESLLRLRYVLSRCAGTDAEAMISAATMLADGGMADQALALAEQTESTIPDSELQDTVESLARFFRGAARAGHADTALHRYASPRWQEAVGASPRRATCGELADDFTAASVATTGKLDARNGNDTHTIDARRDYDAVPVTPDDVAGTVVPELGAVSQYAAGYPDKAGRLAPETAEFLAAVVAADFVVEQDMLPQPFREHEEALELFDDTDSSRRVARGRAWRGLRGIAEDPATDPVVADTIAVLEGAADSQGTGPMSGHALPLFHAGFPDETVVLVLRCAEHARQEGAYVDPRLRAMLSYAAGLIACGAGDDDTVQAIAEMCAWAGMPIDRVGVVSRAVGDGQDIDALEKRISSLVGARNTGAATTGAIEAANFAVGTHGLDRGMLVLARTARDLVDNGYPEEAEALRPMLALDGDPADSPAELVYAVASVDLALAARGGESPSEFIAQFRGAAGRYLQEQGAGVFGFIHAAADDASAALIARGWMQEALELSQWLVDLGVSTGEFGNIAPALLTLARVHHDCGQHSLSAETLEGSSRQAARNNDLGWMSTFRDTLEDYADEGMPWYRDALDRVDPE